MNQAPTCNHKSSSLQVIEVDSAEYLVGNLFKRRFNTETFPQEPFHFVAFAKSKDGSLSTLGYVHYYIDGEDALCGGLVIDNRNYRKLSASDRGAIRDQGGVAQLLLTHSFAKLPNNLVGIWGYVGDKQSKKVCLRSGFETTYHKPILVVWRASSLTDEQKTLHVKRIESIGAF